MGKGSQQVVDSLGIRNRTVWNAIWDEGEGDGRGEEEGGSTHTPGVQTGFSLRNCPSTATQAEGQE